MAWQSPNLRVKWGTFSSPDPDEQQKIITMVVAALKGDGQAIITRRTALEKLAPIFGIENVNAALEALLEEQNESRKQREDDDLLETARQVRKMRDADKLIGHADDGDDEIEEESDQLGGSEGTQES